MFSYKTDACPPDVKRREAIRAGLIAPLYLAASTTATCIDTPRWTKPIFGWGYLIAFVGITVGLLRASRPFRFTGYSVALIALFSVGTWCMYYMYAHSGG